MESKASNLKIAFGLIMNVASSITIILINKWIYVHFKFPNITLTCIHFLMTSLGLLVCRIFKLFKPASLTLMQMLPLSITFCGFVVFTNLSLGTNTVGTYQIIKTMTMPCIMIIQTQFYQKSFTSSIKMTMVKIFLHAFRLVKNFTYTVSFICIQTGKEFQMYCIFYMHSVW